MLLDNGEKRIGNTPMVPLAKIANAEAPLGALYAKVESANPGGSIKDRAALYMLNAAEREGLLSPGGYIVESTSGNTGVGLAWLAAARGYKLVLTMPENMSAERRRLCAAYGARIELTPAKEGMKGAVEKANALARSLNAYMPLQFENPANARAHEETTAPEIFRDLPEAEAIIATVGTGGTLTGIAHGLRSLGSGATIIAVEPEESPLLSRGISGPHGIQGIGANFIPALLDREAIDRVQTVSTPRALEYARKAAAMEGLLVGISSGAAIAAALDYIRSEDYLGGEVVCILPDTGERYLSTELFGDL